MQQDSDTITWAKNCLLANRYILNAPPEVIQKTPYSSVIRFTTSRGNIYLKETPKALSMEAEIILILKKRSMPLCQISWVSITNSIVF